MQPRHEHVAGPLRAHGIGNGRGELFGSLLRVCLHGPTACRAGSHRRTRCGLRQPAPSHRRSYGTATSGKRWKLRISQLSQHDRLQGLLTNRQRVVSMPRASPAELKAGLRSENSTHSVLCAVWHSNRCRQSAPDAEARCRQASLEEARPGSQRQLPARLEVKDARIVRTPGAPRATAEVSQSSVAMMYYLAESARTLSFPFPFPFHSVLAPGRLFRLTVHDD